LSDLVFIKMEDLLFILLQKLGIPKLSYNQSNVCLSYINSLLEKEDSPECFIKYQLIKIKIELRLREIRKKTAITCTY